MASERTFTPATRISTPWPFPTTKYRKENLCSRNPLHLREGHAPCSTDLVISAEPAQTDAAEIVHPKPSSPHKLSDGINPSNLQP